MRSRYVAYKVKNIPYVINTTDPQARFDLDVAGIESWSKENQFTGLEILRCAVENNKGTVEFKATYVDPSGAEHVHHEISTFRKTGGVWYFRQARFVPGSK